MPRFVPDEPAFDPDTPLLHIISQHTYHSSAFIAGNRLGLTRLRDAIESALAAPETTTCAEVMPCDGEGYGTFVRCETERKMELIPYGYSGGGSHDRLPWPHWMSAAR